MWYIVWNIDSSVKQDVLSFETRSGALKYASYYKSLLEVYSAGEHMQKRFGMLRKDSSKSSKLHVSYKLMQREEG